MGDNVWVFRVLDLKEWGRRCNSAFILPASDSDKVSASDNVTVR